MCLALSQSAAVGQPGNLSHRKFRCMTAQLESCARSSEKSAIERNLDRATPDKE